MGPLRQRSASVPRRPAPGDPQSPGSILPSGPFEITGQNALVSALASSLTGLLRAPVVDRTGLAGRYNFTLRYRPGPAIFEALPDQLGLRLQQEKESIEVLVIDSVSKPSEN